MTDCQALLDTWASQYIVSDVEAACVFEGYTELASIKEMTMGRTVSKWTATTVTSSIFLDDGMPRMPTFLQESVLWHEFCHHWDCVENLHVDHCSEFKRLRRRKMGYWLGDIVAKIAAPFYLLRD